jgi:hypothetical protein
MLSHANSSLSKISYNIYLFLEGKRSWSSISYLHNPHKLFFCVVLFSCVCWGCAINHSFSSSNNCTDLAYSRSSI